MMMMVILVMAARLKKFKQVAKKQPLKKIEVTTNSFL